MANAEKRTNPLVSTDELIERVQEALELPSKAAARKALNTVLGVIVSTLEEGASNPGPILRISGFGNFKSVAVPARTARNPQTGESRPCAARHKVSFSLSKNIRDLGK